MKNNGGGNGEWGWDLDETTRHKLLDVDEPRISSDAGSLGGRKEENDASTLPNTHAHAHAHTSAHERRGWTGGGERKLLPSRATESVEISCILLCPSAKTSGWLCYVMQ